MMYSGNERQAEQVASDINPQTDTYNQRHRRYYQKKRQDEAWRLKHNERCKEANARYRERQRQIKIDKGTYRPRGRPRKVDNEYNI